MDAVSIRAQMQQRQQQHGRGPTLRYNGVDTGLLASPYNPNAYMYTNTNLVLPSHYQHSQLPLLPLPTAANRPQHSSLPLRTCSVKLNRATSRKPKSQDTTGNPKRNYQKKESAVLKEHLAVSKKMIRSGQSIITDVREKSDCCKEGERVISDLVFILSPHPSSLPLPRFFMRQRATNKLSCKAEAKAGASDDGLRRVRQLP